VLAVRSILKVDAVIVDVANTGEGVAFAEVGAERRAIFVRGAALGDHTELSVDLSARPAEGRILRLVAPGPARVDPPCQHSLRCGGCAWMHISLPGQVEAHRQRIRAALPDAWRNVPLEVHRPDEDLGYRTRARLHARATGGHATVGLQEAKTHDPVEVDRCIVLHPHLDEARLALGPLLEGAHGRGEAQVALGKEGKPVLELFWRGRLSPKTFGRLETAVKTEALAGARVFEGEVNKPAVWGDPTPWTRGADGEPLRLAPGGFAQASEKGNELLARRLLVLCLDALQPRDRLGRVVELFAGAGNLTALLARSSDRVVAIESSEAACEAHRKNLAARGLGPKCVRVVVGLAEEYALPKGTDLVVLDPPRTGARLVMHRLLEARPKAIAYVSCDVPTLARDLQILDRLYDPIALEAFTMFPHTHHVETLAVLRKRSPS
jgi:23S rRNA (uracil1939-C5)-methyltransferase